MKPTRLIRTSCQGEIKPKDEIEGMLAAQMVAAHSAHSSCANPIGRVRAR